MTLSRASNIFFLFIFFWFSSSAQESNIFNEKSTADFARYLFQSNQYKFAAEEFERLSYLYPEKSEYQLGALKSYRLGGNFTQGIKAYQNFPYVSPDVKKEYALLTLLGGDMNNLNALISSLDPNSSIKNSLELTYRIVVSGGEMPPLDGIKSEKVDPGLMKLYYESTTLKHKSPPIAYTLSVFVPGLGKVYSGRWKDGIMSLVFVGTTAFQAYRGFEKKGVSSVYGWIMGGVSLGFYIGNVYGSGKAAKIYNSNQQMMYVEKVTHYYIDHY